MVLINRYIAIFLSRGSQGRRILFYTRLAAFLEFTIVAGLVTFLYVRFLMA